MLAAMTRLFLIIGTPRKKAGSIRQAQCPTTLTRPVIKRNGTVSLLGVCAGRPDKQADEPETLSSVDALAAARAECGQAKAQQQQAGRLRRMRLQKLATGVDGRGGRRLRVGAGDRDGGGRQLRETPS